MANYVLLDRIELNDAAASVTFDNIPQSGYTDLKVVISARNSINSDQLWVGYNSSTTGFTSRILYGNNATAQSTLFTNRYVGTGEASAMTANTFGNAELYIPNYAGSANKSVSADSVTEANSTTTNQNYQVLAAQLWSNTAPITSIQILGNSGSFVANSTFSLYGIAAVGTTPAIAPKADGGNVIGTDGTYWYHQFNTNGTFTPQVGLTCEVLVVGGGGPGGYYTAAAGGGAGGYRTATGLSITSSSAVTVGAGGPGTQSYVLGTNGTASVFSTISASGGGAGASNGTGIQAGRAGGSGGGGTNGGATGIGGAGNIGAYSPVEGYKGGDSTSWNASGGGSSAAGVAVTSSSNTASGGAGTSNSITGSAVTYAVGGTSFGSGVSIDKTPGAPNTGNGGQGGGSRTSAPSSYGSNGGSGVVIIRYPVN